MHDDNRRATYNNSNQPAVASDLIFTTFEGELKQLIAVRDVELVPFLESLASPLILHLSLFFFFF